jgi:hypothetical protein
MSEQARSARVAAKVAKAEAKALRPWYLKKRWWLAALVVVAIGAMATQGGSESNVVPTTSGQSQSTSSQSGDANTDTTSAPDTTESKETVSQSNARESADSYLDVSAFSREGLIEQLEFEGFSNADATYAVDSLGVDWNEQAAKSAQQYLDVSSFSRSGLIDQLKFEGFTQEQAEYGVNAVGL